MMANLNAYQLFGEKINFIDSPWAWEYFGSYNKESVKKKDITLWEEQFIEVSGYKLDLSKRGFYTNWFEETYL